MSLGKVFSIEFDGFYGNGMDGLYSINFVHKNEKGPNYLYIGKTGDNVRANPPSPIIVRLGEHFDVGPGTTHQITKWVGRNKIELNNYNVIVRFCPIAELTKGSGISKPVDERSLAIAVEYCLMFDARQLGNPVLINTHGKSNRNRERHGKRISLLAKRYDDLKEYLFVIGR